MLAVKESCNPSECSLECVEACQGVQGDDAPLMISNETGRPSIRHDGCTACLLCVRACPLNAIEVESSTTSSARAKKRRNRTTPESVAKQPYEVADDFARFSEAEMIFARVDNDPEFKYYNKSEWDGAKAAMDSGLLGYSQAYYELARAGWELYDHRKSMMNHLANLEGDESSPANESTFDSDSLTKMMKKAARFFGAGLVGIAHLDPRWLYTANRRGVEYSIPDSIDHAVVMAIAMDYDDIATSPTFISSAATALGYSTMAFVEIELAAFIRRLGYRAIPCGNDIALSVPLAIDAGLGQYGRHGLLITEKFGSRVRIAKVLTDMPLLPDGPDLDFCDSVIRFCEVCEKCAEHCPSQSIPFGKSRTWNGDSRSNNPGVKKWYVNVESCYGFWVQNGAECSNCIRSCPYDKRDGPALRIFLWLTRHVPRLNSLVVKLDNLLGYGKQRLPKDLL
ncbi:MAG: reductive dehalogenase [Candidatus Thorarchaeota archaeon]|nr:reductive dehalogenase [Candidatus Thorarchaeota archaeon]